MRDGGVVMFYSPSRNSRIERPFAWFSKLHAFYRSRIRALCASCVASEPRQGATKGRNRDRASGETRAVPNLHYLMSRRLKPSPVATPNSIQDLPGAMTPTTSFDKSAIVEALQAELVKYAPSNTPCAALMLLRLPQLLQSTEDELEPSAGSRGVTALAVAFARVQDDLLVELERKELKPAVSEVRALAHAISQGIITALADPKSGIPRADPANGHGVTSSADAHRALTGADEVDPRQAEQLELLRNVSHELRTPLQAILGWVSLLKGGRLQPEARARALEAIERNAKLQSELITRVLDSGKGAP